MKKRWVFFFLILAVLCVGCKSNKSQNADKKENNQNTESEDWSEESEIPGVGEVEIIFGADSGEEKVTEGETPSDKTEDVTEPEIPSDKTEEDKPSDEKWTEGYY